jgi:hypothetical protein
LKAWPGIEGYGQITYRANYAVYLVRLGGWLKGDGKEKGQEQHPGFSITQWDVPFSKIGNTR